MQNLLILEKLIFLTQSAARVQLVLNLKFQNSRVLETIVFLALFSRRKVSENDLKNSKQLVFSKTFLISSDEKISCLFFSMIIL